MNMVKTRLASGAAAFVFGLATIGGTALTIAAPAYAAPGASGTTSSSGSTSTSGNQPVIHGKDQVQQVLKVRSGAEQYSG